MTTPRNLDSLAHYDTTAGSNKGWSSHTNSDGVRRIVRYGTLMMELDVSKPITTDSILYEREGGSMSDKCGMSRIKRSIISKDAENRRALAVVESDEFAEITRLGVDDPLSAILIEQIAERTGYTIEQTTAIIKEHA